MRKWPWFVLSLLVLVLDQYSKYWVLHNLRPYEPWLILPMLQFTLAYNTGAAFSLLSSSGSWHMWFFLGFSFVMSIVLCIWLWKSNTQDKLQSAGIAFILGGALGNLVDRLSHGYVVDFIDVFYRRYHFATFNIADSAICIGAGLLILDLLVNRR